MIEGGGTFLSDELAKALKSETKMNWELRHMKELDRPWVAEEQIKPFLEGRGAFPPNDPATQLIEP